LLIKTLSRKFLPILKIYLRELPSNRF